MPKRSSPRSKARVTSKGQITIPAKLRQKAGIEAGDAVEFTYEDGRIVLTKGRPIDWIWNLGQSAFMNEWDNKEEDIYNDLA